ncbi:hypothetical protein THRCLA_01807 [Thraustotheca clavata]|uniref:Transmembrane protein n=1 Tax=Thraustotheca clavata TaxID=74557 RepID=A0A1W0A746_9STRA|nr:hypothetical protein THRCLA_01807 [Thraustotheca clavata]
MASRAQAHAWTRYTYINGPYDPNRYANQRVLYPTRRTCPQTWIEILVLPQQSSTFYYLLFHLANAIISTLSCVVASCIVVLYVVTIPLNCWIGALVARIALYVALKLSSFDAHLYNWMTPSGEHIYVSFAITNEIPEYDVFRALVYLAVVKFPVMLITSGIAVASIGASLLLVFKAWFSTPSPLPLATMGLLYLYISCLLCHLLAWFYRWLVRKVCCHTLGLYRYVFGYRMSTRYHEPLHLMGFGTGQVV